MVELPTLRIFLSSPGDVSKERALAQIVFRRLAREVEDAVRLEVVNWEHEPLFAHASMQAQIERPSRCDLVISVLWSRLGTRLPADFVQVPGEVPPTGTQFEIQDALRSLSTLGRPNVLIYRKVPAPEVRFGSPDYDERKRQYDMLSDFCARYFYDENGAILVAHHQFSDSSDFTERLTAHVRAWLDKQITGSSSDPERLRWREGSPFLGLEPFSARHEAIFFGRSQARNEIVQMIRDVEAMQSDARMFLVQGMSGSGKTSLMNAGVLPLLELRPVEGISQWIAVSLRPTQTGPNNIASAGVLGALATKLCELLPGLSHIGEPVEKLATALLERPIGAAERVEDALGALAKSRDLKPGSVRLIIYFDQLEEVFSDTRAATLSQPLFDAMVALARSGSVWIAATLRSDFRHRLEAFPDLVECIGSQRSITLLPPRPHELVDMIREPARAAGLVWEKRNDVSLDQDLLRDAAASPEALPLLEYTLAEIYEKREGRLLKWSAYEGGLRAALVSAADSAVNDLGIEADPSFRTAMRELVSVNENGVATRRYAPDSRFPKDTASRRFVDRMIARRLCVTSATDGGEAVVYLAHEALIANWPLAREWLAKEAEILRKRDELVRDAALWVRHERQNAWLGAEPDKLILIRDVAASGLMPPGDPEEYAQRSRRRATRNAAIRRTAIATIVLLAIVAAAEWRAENVERRRAQNAFLAANYTSNVLTSLFDAANPDANSGTNPTASELLSARVKEIRQDGKNNPEARATVLTAMGRAFIGLGDYRRAKELLTEADKLQAEALKRDAGAIPPSLRVSTLVAAGAVAYRRAQYQTAVSKLESAVQLARDPSLDLVLRSTAIAGLAEALTGRGGDGDLERAVSLTKEAEDELKRIQPPTDESRKILAATLNTLGIAYLSEGDLDSAKQSMNRAIELRRQLFGGDNALFAESVANLGAILYEGGSYEDALKRYDEALAIITHRYTDDHPELGSLLNDIARSKLISGEVNEAREWFVRCVDITQKSLAKKQREPVAKDEEQPEAQNDQLIPPLNSLSMIDAYKGDFDQARKWSQQAEDISDETKQDWLLDQVLLNRAAIEIASGNTDQGIGYLQKSRTQLIKAHPDQKSDAWRYAVWNLVEVERLTAKGQREDALRLLNDARPAIRARFGSTGFYNMVADRLSRALGAGDSLEVPGIPSL